MTIRIRSVAACYVLSCLMSVCVPQDRASAGQATSRSDRETSGLFAVVLLKERPAGRCQYDLGWATGEIPDYIARNEFDLPIRAGLVAPFDTSDFHKALDPTNRIAPSAFCSQEELKTYTATRVSEFKKSSDEHMQIERTTFTYPVFNIRWTKAIVIRSRLELDGRFRFKNGEIGRHPAQSGEYAEVYRKIHGRWRFVRSTAIGMS